MLWLLSACGGDSAASGEDAFVDYWLDSTAFCDKLVDECNAASREECESLAPSEAAVRRAIQLATLDSSDLAKCEQAARASDACTLELSCEALLSSEPACAQPHQRFAIDCANFLTALQFANLSIAGDESPSHGDPGEKDFGERVCQRIAECLGDSTESAAYRVCVDDANESFASMLPDPLEIAACVEQIDCGGLTGDASAVRRCLDLDPAETHCADDKRTLRACNSQGDCTDVDCFAVCGVAPDGVASCSFSEVYGYDTCDCSPAEP